MTSGSRPAASVQAEDEREQDVDGDVLADVDRLRGDAAAARPAWTTSAAVASAATRREHALATLPARRRRRAPSIGATTTTAFHGDAGALVISQCEPRR